MRLSPQVYALKVDWSHHDGMGLPAIYGRRLAICSQMLAGSIGSLLLMGKGKQNAGSERQMVRKGLDRRAREDGSCLGNETTIASFYLRFIKYVLDKHFICLF